MRPCTIVLQVLLLRGRHDQGDERGPALLRVRALRKAHQGPRQ